MTHPRIARVTCVDWFCWIKYSKFKIYYATPKTLPHIVARLATYQHPIELTFPKSIKHTASSLIDNLTHLTQLTLFETFDPTFRDDVVASDWLALTTLTNMEYWNCPAFNEELLQHFPRLRRCYNRTDLGQEAMIKRCPNLEYALAKGSIFLSCRLRCCISEPEWKADLSTAIYHA